MSSNKMIRYNDKLSNLSTNDSYPNSQNCSAYSTERVKNITKLIKEKQIDDPLTLS